MGAPSDRLEARVDIIVLLLIFALLYIVGDLITTAWLVLNDPYGVLQETNPLGRFLYVRGGLLALTVGKLVGFAPVCVASLVFDTKFRNLKWFREVVETTILGLITYSQIIVLNNVLAIIFITALRGSPAALFLIPIVKLLVMLMAVGLNALALYLLKYGDSLRMFEVIVGTVAVAGPLILHEPLFGFLKEQLWLFSLYIVSVLMILGAFFYVFDEIRKKGR